jgi:hypothetical protein
MRIVTSGHRIGNPQSWESQKESQKSGGLVLYYILAVFMAHPAEVAEIIGLAAATAA